MNGWDLGVHLAAAILIIVPTGLFFSYVREIIRRLKEDDWG